MTGSTAVACDGLTVRYRRGTDPVIVGLAAEFVPGTVTAITGPSGSGKSTLLYVLALMLRPSEGGVRWAGVEVSRLPDGERARLRAAKAGFVFQDAMLDPARTVLDNVCEAGVFAGLTRTAAVARATALLHRFGVEHRADHRPGEISGGQAQRVGLCRALVTDPEVVFGDEPTGNLDVEAAAVVWDALTGHAASGATVIVATHDQALTRAADAHLVLT